MLSFTRKITARWQWWVFWLVFAACFNVAMDGYTPFPIIYFFPASLVYASGWLLVYFLDHRLMRRGSNFWHTLFFPSGMVAYEFLLDYLPSGNLMNFAHSQTNFFELMQVTSLTGLWGITFLINWTAAMIVELVEVRASKARLWRPAFILCFVLTAVLSAGYFRLSAAPHYTQTVRVAGIIEPGTAQTTQMIYDRLTRNKSIDREFQKEIKDHAELTSNLLFDLIVDQAEQGAKIVLWPETSVLPLAEDEPQIIDKAAAIAKQYGLYIGMGFGSYDPAGAQNGKVMRNHFVMVTPEGEVAFDYDKQKLVPYVDQQMQAGSDILPVIDTPYGRLGAWICLDGAQSSIAAQAINQGADFIVAPGLDWSGTAPEITKAQLVRATEFGVSVIRVVQWGLSEAVDPYGRTLGANDYTGVEPTFAVDMPTQRTTTVYAALGNWFAWLCVIGFIVGAFAASRGGLVKQD